MAAHAVPQALRVISDNAPFDTYLIFLYYVRHLFPCYEATRPLVVLTDAHRVLTRFGQQRRPMDSPGQGKVMSRFRVIISLNHSPADTLRGGVMSRFRVIIY